MCLYECVCWYDEQSQICMDTVIGILSVFSCSLKRDETEQTVFTWTDLFFSSQCLFSFFVHFVV